MSSNRELTKTMNVRDLPLDSHQKWDELRMRLYAINPGAFKTWADLLGFVTNDKSLWNTIVDMVINEAKKTL